MTKQNNYMAGTDREQYIVKRSIECFAKHGFDVSTRELAKNIGVTQPLIYRYFGSKEQLIQKVYDDVFYSRWDLEWESILSNKEYSMEDRLVRYLTMYTKAILRNDWIRLFIFSALSNPKLCKDYTDLLKSRIFLPVLTEIRAEHELFDVPDDIELELIWGFHSSFFYMGVRRWVYMMDIPNNIDEIIKAKVQHFLHGYHHYLENNAHE
ncbi:TetR/AcrR family transcriptional regulator [Vibrio mediterranei]|uniref:TetR/AcrR family transcriptional regulator n=1 Tax=Vibrio mediterranei TaxID=689 RepID=UPI001EFDBCB9|nr:TetR/AcrR family transcriptional regulator [Vibrio mediterranei]MCG9628634.1 TetR/AcrR family transcriptional regulator [Vibrio mediterranei]